MNPLDYIWLGYGALIFGGYRLCSACSRGLHVDHFPVSCDCDLCTDTDTT